jgi:hypothetical protein
MRQRHKPAPGPRARARAGGHDPHRSRRQPEAHRGAAPHGERAAGRDRRGPGTGSRVRRRARPVGGWCASSSRPGWW